MQYQFIPRHIRGLHLGPGTHYYMHYAHWVREFQAMDLSCVKILDDGSGSAIHFARELRDAGIIPIVRIWRPQPNPGRLPQKHLDAIRGYIDERITLWFEVNNEPNLPHEWKDGQWQTGGQPRNVCNDWLADATAVINLGGYPAFPALAQCADHGECSSIRWYDTAFTYLQRQRYDETKRVFQNGAWLAVHCATLNHVQEIDGEWRFDFPYFRRRDKTVFDDDCSLLGFQVPVKHLWDKFGIAVPVMSTEGGVFFNDGAQWDKYFPAMNEWNHENWTIKMFEWLQRYKARFPWFLAMMPWLAGDMLFGQDIRNWWEEGWWRLDGKVLSVVQACKTYHQAVDVPKIPVNKCGERLAESWDTQPAPQPPPDPVEPPAPPPVPEGFPRPDADNGIGIHLGLGNRLVGGELAEDIDRIGAMRMTWAMLAFGAGEDVMLEAARQLWAAGIMPVVRKVLSISPGYPFGRDAKLLADNGIPAYVQIFNEPSDDREWETARKKKKNYLDSDKWAIWWVQAAKDVIANGGYPGFQCLHPHELETLFRVLPASDPVWKKTWFCSHNYGLNHPPDWEGDYWSVLGFQVFADMFQAYLGRVPPIICGEGGWLYNASDDSNYPKVDADLHADYHAQMYWWFARGELSSGEPLPSYLYAVCPWILSGASDEAWYGFTTKTKTIERVHAIPVFERGDVVGPEDPTPNPPPRPPDSEADFDGLSQEMIDALVIIPASGEGDIYWKVTRVEIQPQTDNMSAYAVLPPHTDVEVLFSWPDGSIRIQPKADALAPEGAREWAASYPMFAPWGGYSLQVEGNSEKISGIGLYGSDLEKWKTEHHPVLVWFEERS